LKKIEPLDWVNFVMGVVILCAVFWTSSKHVKNAEDVEMTAVTVSATALAMVHQDLTNILAELKNPHGHVQ
jgi:hypothetical protein